MDRLFYKILFTEYCLDRICIYASSVGVIHFHQEHIKHHWLYNRILINFILIVVLLREITSLLSNDRRVSLMLGDMAFNWEFKPIWNLIVMTAITLTLSVRALHYWHYKHGHIPIELRNQSNKLEIRRNADLIISFIENYMFMLIISFPFFVVQTITFWKSCTVFELFTYGLFGTILMGIVVIYLPQCVLANIFYFCFLAYNLKLRLELENIRLKQLSTKHLPKVLIERQLLRIISRIFKIYKQIKDENKFWSKWLLIQITWFSTFSSLFINQLIFGESNMFIFIFFTFANFCIYLVILMFSISCIRLHDESNKTVKIIRQLNFKFYETRNTQHKHSIKVKYNKIIHHLLNITDLDD